MDFEALKMGKGSPTNPFTILELLNPSSGVPELYKIRRSTDLKAFTLGKGSSGRQVVNVI